uniref:Uncharacterized protein n=1 Tax=Eutreptiella gymnastica TaxID=73025 RepID=A0A7S4GBR9_9EUGL|mmetsp:Transcript_35611/g.58103  ORF Transcript_35611/g.58103 Transcript_35611/m.58103 type:complete len:100 (+) Transcript_35611:56-355(+)
MSPPSPSLYKCVTNAKSCIQDHKKTEVPENPGNSGSTPTPCLDQPVLAQGGGGPHSRGTAPIAMATVPPPLTAQNPTCKGPKACNTLATCHGSLIRHFL